MMKIWKLTHKDRNNEGGIECSMIENKVIYNVPNKHTFVNIFLTSNSDCCTECPKKNGTCLADYVLSAPKLLGDSSF